MTIAGKWHVLDGGLKIAVTPYDRTSSVHREAAGELLAGSVKKVASVHGAGFSEAGFRNVLRFLNRGDIKAEFYEAAWDICRPKLVGGAFYYNAVGIDPSGKPRLGRYTEDVCLLSRRLRDLINDMPKDSELPIAGLGASFDRISLQKLRENTSHGVAPQYRFGEFDYANKAMVNLLEGTGAILGDPESSAVLELQEIPEIVRSKFPMTVKKINLRLNNEIDPHNFITSWRRQSDGMEEGVDLIVTRGFSTANSGASIAHMRPERRGILPDDGILDCVLASLILRAEKEIREERHWGAYSPWITANDQTSYDAIDAIPDNFTDLLESCANEVFLREVTPSLAFGSPMPVSHIHILNDRALLDAFKRLAAKERLFGVRPMVPGVNYLNDNEIQKPEKRARSRTARYAA